MSRCYECGDEGGPGRFCGSCGGRLAGLAQDDVPETTASKKLIGSHRGRTWIPAMIAALLLALAALGVVLFQGLQPEDHTLHGTLTIFDGNDWASKKGPCAGGGSGHDDLSAGAQVTLLGTSGEVVGVGELREGSLTGRGGCKLPFTITGVKETRFYQLKSQSTLRPGTTYSLDRMKKDEWRIDVGVGDETQAAVDSRADCLNKSAAGATATLIVKPGSLEAPQV